MYAIYIITNIINAKQYVGITNNLERRWRRHKAANDNQLLHKAIKKHNVNNFVFTHFANAFDVESAKSIEQMLIISHNTFAPNGYNLTKGGDGTFGYKHSDESKHKSSISNKKTWSDQDLRQSNGKKISAVKKGIPSAKKGKPSGRKGMSHSCSHAQNIKLALSTKEYVTDASERAKKLWSDPEFKAKQSASRKAAWAIRKAKQSSMIGEAA